MRVRRLLSVCSGMMLENLSFPTRQKKEDLLFDLLQDYDDWYYAAKSVVAVTDDTQEEAEEWLKSLGFTGVGPFSNPDHDEDTETTVWVSGYLDFIKNLKKELTC